MAVYHELPDCQHCTHYMPDEFMPGLGECYVMDGMKVPATFGCKAWRAAPVGVEMQDGTDGDAEAIIRDLLARPVTSGDSAERARTWLRIQEHNRRTTQRPHP